MGQEGSLPLPPTQQGGSQGSLHAPSGHSDGGHGATQNAEQALRLLNSHYAPQSTSIVRATENAPELGARFGRLFPWQRRIAETIHRELAISSTLANLNPEALNWSMIAGAIRRGFVDKVRIQFDSEDYTEFIPKLTRILSYCDKIQALELYSDQMMKKRLLPFYSYPNVLNSLPKAMPALTNFTMATTLGQLVHFDVVATVLLRASNLKACAFQGMRFGITKNVYAPFIPVHLHTLILIRCHFEIPLFHEVLCRSGRSLKILHLEHITGAERDPLAQIISSFLPELMKLTLILPEALALSGGVVELHEILDTATVQPILSVFELFATGLSCTDLSFLRATNNIGALKTQWPSLSRLTLHQCSRVRMSSLVIAIKTGRFPRLAFLEALDAKDFEKDDLIMLYKTCLEARIQLSREMVQSYAWLHSSLGLEETMLEKKGKAKEVLDEELKELVASMTTPAATMLDTPYSQATSSVSGSSSRRSRTSQSTSRSRSRSTKAKSRSRSRHSRRVESSSESTSDVSSSESATTEDSSSDEPRHRGRHHHDKHKASKHRSQSSRRK